MLKKVGIWLFVLAIAALAAIILPKKQGLEIPEIIQESSSKTEIVAENLEIPWEVAFLPASPAGGPDGSFLVTERPGRLLKIGEDKKIIQVEGVRHIGEGGLLGLALHPDFNKNQFVYLYFTTEGNGKLTNRIERYRLEDTRLLDRKVILEGILGSSVHDGGRIAFGSDGKLYITTGDAGNSNLAQDKNSLNGKILRVNDDGTTPNDNPFGTAVWSYGHRNPQGLVWDDQGRLWSTEHGRSGAQSGFDELNLIEKGKNYGWPVIQGDEQQEGMVTPVKNSGADVTWAPAGAAFLPADRQDVNGSIFFGGLRGETLYEYKISEGKLIEHFKGVYGRIRSVVLGPDRDLYITTSNKDGRGDVKTGDDKLIKIDLQQLD